MAEPVLITGITGNVGREVARRLREAGQPVRGAVREPGARGASGGGIEWVPFDFEKPDTWEPAFAGIRRLFLVRPPALSDVKRTLNPALDVAKRMGVEHVVFLSLQGVERNKVVPHAKVEEHLQRLGLATTSLRASFFMQNLDTTHRVEIRDGDELFIPAGRGKTSFIDVRDIAEVAARALLDSASHRGKAYTLTGGEALDYFQVAALFSRVLGRPIRYSDPSPLAYGRRMHERGMPLPFILVTEALYMVVRLGLAAGVTPETAQLLGRPPITLEQYIRDYADCWRKPATREAGRQATGS
jgi:uncharacterized protein YbjT (DUF2867 family)